MGCFCRKSTSKNFTRDPTCWAKPLDFSHFSWPSSPPPKKTTNILEKKHLNTLKTMRTSCEVAQRLGRERELADNSLDRMEKELSKTKIEREGGREREREREREKKKWKRLEKRACKREREQKRTGSKQKRAG